jgi:molybdate transport system substrate-binding protein
MGDPGHVPAGIYGQAALESLGVWETVAPHVARADNVRAALALVARGETPLGVVYRSDAVADDTVKVIDDFPQDSFPEIVYPIAIVAASEHAEATALVDMLHAEAAAAIFERYGFAMLE